MAKLAYLDMEEKDYQKLVDSKNGDPPTVQQWIDYNYVEYVCNVMGIEPSEVSEDTDIEELIASQNLSENKQETINMLKAVRNGEALNGWKLLDTRNENQTTGFAGCFLETDTEDAVVGFRGSESSSGQFWADWIIADFGLPFTPTIEQQKSAENYMRYIYENYGYKYDSFYTAGHSLGGNLAFHAAVTGDRIYGDKLKWAYSLDAPGFTKEDYILHGKEIQKLSDNGVLNHYAWTAIGTLFCIGEPPTQFIEAEHWDVFNGHVLESLSRNLDSNGNFKPGDFELVDHGINIAVTLGSFMSNRLPIEILDRMCEFIDTKIKENTFKKDAKEHDYENKQQIAEYLKRIPRARSWSILFVVHY